MSDEYFHRLKLTYCKLQRCTGAHYAFLSSFPNHKHVIMSQFMCECVLQVTGPLKEKLNKNMLNWLVVF